MQIKAEVPNVEEAVAQVIMGAAWPGPGTSKAKTVKAAPSVDLEIGSKGLRYGACLVVESMSMTYHREDKSSKVTVKYTMER